MSTTRKVIVAFWVVIVGMLTWQLISYNTKLNKGDPDHPEQTTFVFLHTNAAPVAPSMAHTDKADVEQVAYSVQRNTPATGSFTCLVTLKNVGKVPATDVQISVRPYRGASNFDEDVGHQHAGALSDDDPLSKFNDWLSFPDLAPGETATRPIVFTERPEIGPGSNPKPQIVFKSDKNGPTKPAPAPPPDKTTPSNTPAPAPHTHHSADD